MYIYAHAQYLHTHIYIMYAYTQCMYTCIYIYIYLFIHIHRHIHVTQKSHPRFSYQCDPMTRSRMISTSPRCTNSDPVGPLQGLATLAMWRPSVMPPCAKVSRRLGWLGRDLQLCYFGYPAFFWGRKWMKIHRRWSLTSGNMELWGILQAMLDQTGRCSGYFGLRTRRGLLNHIYCPQIPAANVEHIFLNPQKASG